MIIPDALLAGAGGVFGAVARYILGKVVMERWGKVFPLGTFLINISGAFILCLFTGLTTMTGLLPHWASVALTTGFLGAYTTFSTFAYETIQLIEDGERSSALLYAGGSILIGLLAGWLGLLIGGKI